MLQHRNQHAPDGANLIFYFQIVLHFSKLSLQFRHSLHLPCKLWTTATTCYQPKHLQECFFCSILFVTSFISRYQGIHTVAVSQQYDRLL